MKNKICGKIIWLGADFGIMKSGELEYYFSNNSGELLINQEVEGLMINEKAVKLITANVCELNDVA